MPMNKILNFTRGELASGGENRNYTCFNLSSEGETLNDTHGKLSPDGETLNVTRGTLSPVGETFLGQKFSKLLTFSLVLMNVKVRETWAKTHMKWNFSCPSHECDGHVCLKNQV